MGMVSQDDQLAGEPWVHLETVQETLNEVEHVFSLKTKRTTSMSYKIHLEPSKSEATQAFLHRQFCLTKFPTGPNETAGTLNPPKVEKLLVSMVHRL